jgi:hypothetical protein
MRWAAFGGYLARASSRHAGMLLRLRGIGRARRLREDVRVEEVCCAVVGHQLRQAAHAYLWK